jgi:hypothetical protein
MHRGAPDEAKAMPQVHAHTGWGRQEFENVTLCSVLTARDGGGMGSNLSRRADAPRTWMNQVVDLNTTCVSRPADVNSTRHIAERRAALNPTHNQEDS